MNDVRANPPQPKTIAFRWFVAGSYVSAFRPVLRFREARNSCR